MIGALFSFSCVRRLTRFCLRYNYSEKKRRCFGFAQHDIAGAAFGKGAILTGAVIGKSVSKRHSDGKPRTALVRVRHSERAFLNVILTENRARRNVILSLPKNLNRIKRQNKEGVIMDANKLTQKSLQAMQGAQNLALEYGNAEITTLHLAYALSEKEIGRASCRERV